MTNLKNYRPLFFLLLMQTVLWVPFHSSAFSKGRKYYMDARTPKGLQELFHYTGERVPFLSAHRGGAGDNFPENCTATFENTLENTWALMEIDPRYTKDSVIIVHHDPTLDRTTNGTGRVSDFTFEELQKLRLKDPDGQVTAYRIPTLEELLAWAKAKTVLVLDRKDVPVLERVEMIEKFHAESCAIVMAYTFEEAQQVYKRNPDIMMQVFINSPEKVREFDQTGVPWENIVAFVGHQMPEDRSVFDLIHQKGALCILGTSRNLDKELLRADANEMLKIKLKYQELFELGADILETDIPVLVSKLFPEEVPPPYYSKYLK
jgi:glycerophosphoryl diester phosphodiesterase